jgi:hypothetical protein
MKTLYFPCNFKKPSVTLGSLGPPFFFHRERKGETFSFFILCTISSAGRPRLWCPCLSFALCLPGFIHKRACVSRLEFSSFFVHRVRALKEHKPHRPNDGLKDYDIRIQETRARPARGAFLWKGGGWIGQSR